jgi:hypothetical protein
VQKRRAATRPGWNYLKKNQSIEQLQRLWDEANHLADDNVLPTDPGLEAWRQTTLDALTEIYGAASRERAQFEAIRFDLDERLLKLAEKLLPDRLVADGFDVSEVKIQLDQRRHCAKRLSDAAELLLSFVVGLRGSA